MKKLDFDIDQKTKDSSLRFTSTGFASPGFASPGFTSPGCTLLVKTSNSHRWPKLSVSPEAKTPVVGKNVKHSASLTTKELYLPSLGQTWSRWLGALRIWPARVAAPPARYVHWDSSAEPQRRWWRSWTRQSSQFLPISIQIAHSRITTDDGWVLTAKSGITTSSGTR